MENTTSERLFLDIHAIQAVPPANINRDDTGSPKRHSLVVLQGLESVLSVGNAQSGIILRNTAALTI